MVVLGSARLVCPHCGQVQFQPLARRYRCRGCSKTFTAAAARPTPRRALTIVLLGLGACTIDNPLFGDGDGGSSGGSTGSSTLGMSSTDAPTTMVATTNDTTGNDDVVPGETSAQTDPSDTAPSDTESSSLDLPGECQLPEPVDLVILADDQEGPSDPVCTDVWTSGEGALAVEGNTIRIRNCACPCVGEGRPDHTVAVTGIDLGGLPACGSVVAYPSGSSVSCHWKALVVEPALDAAPPALVASRGPGIPDGVLGDLQVAAGEDIPCGTGRCEKSGLYALDFDDGMSAASISMDEDPVPFPIPSLDGAFYSIDNVSAVIDDACHEHFVWTARKL